MVRHLCNRLHSSINPEELTAEEVYDQMSVLVGTGLLESEFPTRTGEYATFSITADGMLVINRILGRVSRARQDKKIDERDID